jgi:NAD(P)-dependent dehydrogenase (short-subunit alcohol dehydrogenase family)
MSKEKWGHQNIPSQKGKVIIVTGATSGLGKEAVKVLAAKGARIIAAVRNTEKAEKVVQEIKKTNPAAIIDIQRLDLASLDSIKAFAERIAATYKRLDVLINNAGVMACPFSKTEDGFEIQMGVNHFGNFALTGLLMPLLESTKGARIVVTSSVAHRFGNINFEDINWTKRTYSTSKAYGDSKIANLYFTYELAERMKNKPNAPLVTAAHPGWTSTELQRHSLFYRVLNPLFSQSVEFGTLPTLRAAIDEASPSAAYYGPSGFMEIKGAPVLVKSNVLSHNKKNAQRLWELSEELTGVHY